jgi:ribonuclease HI
MSTNMLITCKADGALLVKKITKRSTAQLKKPYYYTAYLRCPVCDRMYHVDAFKIVNDNYELFTKNETMTLRKSDINIWTDGASSNNGKPHAKAAWAFVAGKKEDAGPVDGKQTNNRGEALAIFHALVWAASKGYKHIRIHSDSQITLFGVAKHPDKVKENRDIFQRIHDTVIKNDLKVEYVKVLGHSGDVNNERVDQLAVKLTIS